MNTPPKLPPEGLAVIIRRPGAKLVAPLIIGVEVEWYARAVLDMPDDTVVLWPWPGQYRTDVFWTTAGEIVEAIVESTR